MLGEKIKNIREKRKMGLRETARIAGVSGSYLSTIENGKKKNPSIETLQKIADALDVSLEDLLKEENEPGKTSITDFDEKEILTQAAHKVGHKGKLSEEELNKIKLALKIALIEDEKNNR